MIKIYVPERTIRLIADFCGKVGAISNVYFERVGDTLNVVATNGSVMAMRSITFGDGWEMPMGGFAADLKGIAKNFSKTCYQPVCITEDGGGYVSFKLSSTGSAFVVQKFNGVFPNYKAVIPPIGAPKAQTYQPIAWKNLRLIESIIGNNVYDIPQQKSPYTPMMWVKGEWTLVCMPIVR